MDITATFWSFFISTIRSLSLRSDLLFAAFSVAAALAISSAPFKIVRALNDTDSWGAVQRWRVVLLAPAAFVLVPTLSMVFLILTGRRLDVSWQQQASAFANIAGLMLIAGVIWGGILSAKAARRAAIDRREALEHQQRSTQIAALEMERASIMKRINDKMGGSV